MGTTAGLGAAGAGLWLTKRVPFRTTSEGGPEVVGLLGREPFKIDAHLFQHAPFLVNFFASWCVPCREEHPAFMAVSRSFDIAMVGVGIDDHPDDLAEYLERSGNPFDIVGIDTRRYAQAAFAVVGPPYTLIFAGDGRLALTHPGPVSLATLSSAINAL